MTTLAQSQNRTVARFLADGVRSLRARFDAQMAVVGERRRISRELMTYSDDELAELGFSRFDIPAIASGSYRR
ncbi:hypothetical protein ACELLULO517_11320 [Acidisoma cellulosilytica]|uniref:DUF1127 domain-containing protein n=1 Tax=Acidisoma cellulosilyticum TaxID=2802395 RepID=A0A963Z167_9PROT|nr:hypothetical protein [Acidisoma cellulosilyticum]MCB8880825.1 hypothetical protein [Acidisoma cellulosilyticum]